MMVSYKEKHKRTGLESEERQEGEKKKRNFVEYAAIVEQVGERVLRMTCLFSMCEVVIGGGWITTVYSNSWMAFQSSLHSLTGGPADKPEQQKVVCAIVVGTTNYQQTTLALWVRPLPRKNRQARGTVGA